MSRSQLRSDVDLVLGGDLLYFVIVVISCLASRRSDNDSTLHIGICTICLMRRIDQQILW